MSKKENTYQVAHAHVSVTPGEALRMIRELQGLSQNQLSKLTGISQSNISALENGTRQFGRERAIVFAQVLDVHPAVLLFPDYDYQKAA